MANVNFYKSHTEHFLQALTIFVIITFQIRDIENVDHDVQHSQWRHSMANT